MSPKAKPEAESSAEAGLVDGDVILGDGVRVGGDREHRERPVGVQAHDAPGGGVREMEVKEGGALPVVMVMMMVVMLNLLLVFHLLDDAGGGLVPVVLGEV